MFPHPELIAQTIANRNEKRYNHIMIKLVAATRNKGKLAELTEMLGDCYEILPVSEFSDAEPEENGVSFEENARIKAHAAYAASGLPSFGDDSGLCVDALGGAPGIYSSRYAENAAARNAKLLAALSGVPENKRTARFVCSIVYYDGKREFSVCGECKGSILFEETGTEGFGYDPVFRSDDLGKPFGLASPEEKDGVSHRGRAVRQLAEKLKEIFD